MPNAAKRRKNLAQGLTFLCDVPCLSAVARRERAKEERGTRSGTDGDHQATNVCKATPSGATHKEHGGITEGVVSAAGSFFMGQAG
jgi:hypothetical protein